MDIVEMMRSILGKYIEKDQLESELDELEKEWAIDDKTTENKITREIANDTNILLRNIEELVKDKEKETIDRIINGIHNDFTAAVEERNNRIGELERKYKKTQRSPNTRVYTYS